MPAIYHKGKRYGSGGQGVSITDVELVQPNNELVVTLSDGNKISAGQILISEGEIVLSNYYTKDETEQLVTDEFANSVLSEQEIRDIFI